MDKSDSLSSLIFAWAALSVGLRACGDDTVSVKLKAPVPVQVECRCPAPGAEVPR